LLGPGQTNADFSIGKQFNVRERQYVEFRAEFFNRFNQVNLANPISDLNAVAVPGGSPVNAATGPITNRGSFGLIISASSNARLIQLGLKYRF
jgi:hypothetical protein